MDAKRNRHAPWWEPYLAHMTAERFTLERERVACALFDACVSRARFHVGRRRTHGIDDRDTHAQTIAADATIKILRQCPEVFDKPGSILGYVTRAIENCANDAFASSTAAIRGGGRVVPFSQLDERAVNTAIEVLRAVPWDQSSAPERDDMLDPETRLIRKEAEKDAAGVVSTAMASLSQADRRLLALPTNEIAERSGCSRRTAQYRRKAVRRKVRDRAAEILRRKP